MIVPDWAGYHRFRPLFEEVLDPRLYSIEWLDRMLLTGAFRLWVGENAAIVAKVETYPTGARELHGQIAAGDLQEIVEVLIPRAEEWARAAGCIATRIESRPGWVKALSPHGYELHQVAVRKEL